jgi:hypothetical protein
MKIERTRAQKGVPVHTRYPETYIFLGVRMKILLSSKIPEINFHSLRA